MNIDNGRRPLCGEIWMCKLADNEDGVQSGYRPVFILSNNMNNAYSPTANVIPLTSKMNKRNLPIHVEIWDYESCGLKSPSTMMIEQTTTISKNCLCKRIGRITDDSLMKKIVSALMIQFPIIVQFPAMAHA